MDKAAICRLYDLGRCEVDAKVNIIPAVAGFLSGTIGAMGMGGGGVLLIYLTVFANVEQLQAQGINLLFFLPTGLAAIIIYSIKRQIDWKKVFKMWLGGIVGAGLGFFLAKVLDTTVLSKLFAVFLIVFGLWQLFAKQKEIPPREASTKTDGD